MDIVGNCLQCSLKQHLKRPSARCKPHQQYGVLIAQQERGPLTFRCIRLSAYRINAVYYDGVRCCHAPQPAQGGLWVVQLCARSLEPRCSCLRLSMRYYSKSKKSMRALSCPLSLIKSFSPRCSSFICAALTCTELKVVEANQSTQRQNASQVQNILTQKNCIYDAMAAFPSNSSNGAPTVAFRAKLHDRFRVRAMAPQRTCVKPGKTSFSGSNRPSRTTFSPRITCVQGTPCIARLNGVAILKQAQDSAGQCKQQLDSCLMQSIFKQLYSLVAREECRHTAPRR